MIKYVAPIAFSLILFCSCQPKTETAAAAADTVKVKEPGAAGVKSVNELPQITLIEESGTRFSATTLPANSILIFFSSDCDHCQREATDVEKNIDGFKNYSLYFISMNQFSQMKKFAETYKLADKSNVKFLQADGATVFKAMGSIETPTICVYGKDKQLTKRFDGETKADLILKVL
jgi:peroxiredoxin